MMVVDVDGGGGGGGGGWGGYNSNVNTSGETENKKTTLVPPTEADLIFLSRVPARCYSGVLHRVRH
jgi:hypothetical protein